MVFNRSKKKFFILSIFFFVLSFQLFSTETDTIISGDQDLFLNGNHFYRQGEFEKAKDFYLQIKDKNSLVYYNLGNSYYKLDLYGYALLYWKKAEKKWGVFGKGELLDNIAKLKLKLFGEEKKTTNLFHKIKNYSISFIKSVPLFIIQAIFLILWLFLFLYIKFLYKSGHNFLIKIFFVLILMMGVVLVIRYTFDFRRQGVVLTKKASLLSVPGDNLTEIGSIQEAKEVCIKKEQGGYFKVKINGRIGWVSSQEVGEI